MNNAKTLKSFMAISQLYKKTRLRRSPASVKISPWNLVLARHRIFANGMHKRGGQLSKRVPRKPVVSGARRMNGRDTRAQSRDPSTQQQRKRIRSTRFDPEASFLDSVDASDRVCPSNHGAETSEGRPAKRICRADRRTRGSGNRNT